jgi:proteasome lid subunit RPN8/RPN11
MLKLSSELEKRIRRDGETAYPNECCGILFGKVDNDGVKTAMCEATIKNASEDGEQYHRFLITPEDMMKAEQSARSMKLDVIGFYHSHPDHPSAPSGYDKDHALPFYSYVIVSVDKGKAQILTSWELTNDRSEFTQEEVNLTS